MTRPAGQAQPTISNFWSGTPGSAWWNKQLPNGQWQFCSTQAKTFFRVLRRAVYGAQYREPTSSNEAWNSRLTNDIYDYATNTMGLARLPFTRSQTTWTTDMLFWMIMFAYYRDQILSLRGETVMLPEDVVLPFSNEAPPADGVPRGEAPPPTCRSIQGPLLEPPPSRTAPQFPLAPDTDFSVSNFWSADPNTARWEVVLPDGAGVQCATQAKSFLKNLKSALSGVAPFRPDDNGAWSPEWTQRLRFYAINSMGISSPPVPETVSGGSSLLLPPVIPGTQIPTPGVTPPPGSETYRNLPWTLDMLRVAIWATYYSHGLVDFGGRPQTVPAYTSIRLPADTVLPQNATPPDDHSGDSLVNPICRLPPAVAPPATVPTTTTPTAPPEEMPAIVVDLVRRNEAGLRAAKTFKLLVTGALGIALGWWLAERKS